MGGILDQGDDSGGEGVIHRDLRGCFVGGLDLHASKDFRDLGSLLVLGYQDSTGDTRLEQAMLGQQSAFPDMRADPFCLAGDLAGLGILGVAFFVAFLLFGLEITQADPQGLTYFRLFLILGSVITPDVGPLAGGIGGEEGAMFGQVAEQVVQEVHHRLGAAARIVEAVISFLRDVRVLLAQKLRIAGTPAVEALLEVSDEEYRPPFGTDGMLADDFIDVIFQHLVLAGARILEFIEQPMLHFAVEAVVDVELALRIEE